MNRFKEDVYNRIENFPKANIPTIPKVDFFTKNLFNDLNLSKEFLEEISCFEDLLMSITINMIGVASLTNKMVSNADRLSFIKEEMLLIKDKIIKDKLKRSKIIGKVYNYATSKVEYELEDGNYVPIDGSYQIKLDKNVFPKEFLFLTGEMALYRDKRIESILEES